MAASPGTSHSTVANSGAYLKGLAALAPATVGAGVGGSGTYQDGPAINRVDPVVALSAKYTTVVKATMASGNNTVFRQRIEHRADSTEAWAEPSTDVLTQPDDVTVTALDAGGAQTTQLNLNVDLSGLKSEVRFRLRPTMSASGVDTIVTATSVVLGGLNDIPIAGY